MDPNCNPVPTRAKIPKDGFGPRGLPDCYYTSRVLDSTFRYVRFIKKLRATEEEQRRGRVHSENDTKNTRSNNFFRRCDRKALVMKVAHRVDLCLESYETDLKMKRQRLIDLYTQEEKGHIRKLVEQTQEGTELLWQEKQDRLAYLLAKRKKENEDKYKDTPLTKCTHVLPCLTKLRAKEAEEIQLYQMREKKMRKLAEGEIEKMWYDVAMKEAEALSARMELDAIERSRRDQECKNSADNQIKEKRAQRAREQEILKQEALKMQAQFEADMRKEAEEERERQEKNELQAKEKNEMLQERKITIAKQEADAKLTNDTWDSLAGQGLAANKAQEELRRQKERELDVCNRRLAEMKHRIALVKFNNDPLIQQEGQRRQDAVDLKRCQARMRTLNIDRQTCLDFKDQIEKKAAMKKTENEKDAEEYNRQLQNQLDQLVKHKELTDAQARKLYQKDLLDQIAYNKLLKERAKQEDLEQMKKCQLAAEEYQREINKMVCRPFFSDEVHPFMKQMSSGLKMKPKCPCSATDYCAEDPSLSLK